jgi:hypothetical protein
MRSARNRATERAWRTKWTPEYRAQRNAKTREWAAANRDLVRVIQRRYLGIPEATRPCPDRCENEGCRNIDTKRPLMRDHDHKTGTFRGWICSACNTAIGKLGDDIEGLKAAIRYLEKALGQPTIQ